MYSRSQARQATNCLEARQLPRGLHHTDLIHYTWELGALTRVTDVTGRRSLRSATNSRLLVPLVRPSTINSDSTAGAFTVACWSPCLERPARGDDQHESAQSLRIFCERLKHGFLDSHTLPHYHLNCYL